MHTAHCTLHTAHAVGRPTAARRRDTMTARLPANRAPSAHATRANTQERTNHQHAHARARSHTHAHTHTSTRTRTKNARILPLRPPRTELVQLQVHLFFTGIANRKQQTLIIGRKRGAKLIRMHAHPAHPGMTSSPEYMTRHTHLCKYQISVQTTLRIKMRLCRVSRVTTSTSIEYEYVFVLAFHACPMTL